MAGAGSRPGGATGSAAGETIELPGHDGGPSAPGRGAHLAVAGGIDVPLVLGSRSTCLAGGFGGHEGRALRAGDVIRSLPRTGAEPARAELAWPEDDDAGTRPIRRPAAASRRAASASCRDPRAGLDALVGEPWRVSPAGDRVGVRLEGRSLPDGIGGETLTHGVPWGAVQVPSDGRPILLSADHQTTGGYRVPAVVISADLPILGQLLPGDEVVLEATDLASRDRGPAATRARPASARRCARALLREARPVADGAPPRGARPVVELTRGGRHPIVTDATKNCADERPHPVAPAGRHAVPRGRRPVGRPSSGRRSPARSPSLAAIGLSELVAGFLGGPSLLASIGEFVIDHQPPGAKDFVVGLFGTNDKLALEVLILVFAALIGALPRDRRGPLVVHRGCGRLRRVRPRRVLPPRSRSPAATPTTSMIVALVGGVAGVQTLSYLLHAGPGRGASGSAGRSRGEPTAGRRQGRSTPTWSRRASCPGRGDRASRRGSRGSSAGGC